jgi:hypothetical protein
MKKFYSLLVFIIALSVAVNGQIYIEESFNDSEMPPDGWSLDGYENQWGVSGSTYSGGEAPEGRYARTTATGTTRFISPEIDLTGETTVMFSFRHVVFDRNSTDYSVGVATRSGGGDWNTVWEIFPSDDVGPELKLIAFDNEDVGADDFQFCFFIDGNLNNLSYWFMDDIKLFIPFALDAEMIEITMTDQVYNADEVTGTLKNVGQNEITELEIKWQVPGEDVHTTTITDISVAPAELYDFTCSDLFFFPPGDYELEVWVTKINGEDDMNPNDNMAAKEITVLDGLSVYRVPFFEEFTASTCPPCYSFNLGFVPWCEEHADEIALLKYQMNWPGAGDPYYTAEGGVRKSYYGVSGVPDLFGNGGDVSTSVPAVENFFNQASQLPGFISIAGSYSIEGTVINIDANILPYQDFPTLRLYVAVFEWLTTGNVGTNGETEFENVMMKMVPNASGTDVDLNNMEIYEFSESVDLASTFVEEYDDLGVVFFLQNYSTREIHQSAYGLEDYEYSSDARLSEIRVNNIPIEGFDPDVTGYTVELPEGVTEIMPVTASPMAGDPVITYEYPDVVPGEVIISVRAEDLTTTNTYTVMLTLYTDIEESYQQSVSIYPNPTAGLLNVAGADNATISVFNISGQLVSEISSLRGNTINLSALPNGMYLVKIQKGETIITKKVSLNK